MKCFNCDAPAEDNAHYCEKCGAKLSHNHDTSPTETSYSEPPQQNNRQTRPSESSIKFAPPSGYTYNPQNGMYYKVEKATSLNTGEPVKRVVYFDSSNGSYTAADYNQYDQYLGHFPYTPKGTKRKTILAVISIVLAITLVLTIIAGIVYNYKIAAPKQTAPPEEGEERHTWDDFLKEWRNKPDDEEEEQQEESINKIDLEDLRPFSDDVSELKEIEYYQDSVFTANAKTRNGVTYFLSPNPEYLDSLNEEEQEETDEETPESEEDSAQKKQEEDTPESSQESEETSPEDKPESTEDTPSKDITHFNQNCIYRLKADSSSEAEILVQAANGYTLQFFEVIGEHLFYTTAPYSHTSGVDYNNMSYYHVPLDGSSAPTKIYTGFGNPAASYNGYLFVLAVPDIITYSESDTYLLQIGLDENGGLALYYHDIQLPDNVSYHMEDMSIRDGKIFLTTFYYTSETGFQRNYYYDIDKKNLFEVFQGDEGYMYRNIFVFGQYVYFARYNVDATQAHPVQLGSAKLGEHGTTTYFSDKDSIFWEDNGPYINRLENDIYYENDGVIVKAPLSDVRDTKEVCPAETEVYGATDRYIFFQDGKVFDLKKSAMDNLNIDILKTPIVEKAGKDPVTRDPETSTSADFFLDEASFIQGIAYMEKYLSNPDQVYFIDSAEYLKGSGCMFHAPKMKSIFVADDGKINTEKVSVFLLEMFGEDIENYTKEVAEGNIAGLIYKSDEIYLDPDWELGKEIIEIKQDELDLELYSVEVIYSDDSTFNFGLSVVETTNREKYDFYLICVIGKNMINIFLE